MLVIKACKRKDMRDPITGEPIEDKEPVGYIMDVDGQVPESYIKYVPNGAISKEGPSAGVNLTTALISAFTNLKINSNIAMTGEITLRGNVLAIGGLKEKIMGAKRNNIKVIFIPYDNNSDLEDIPNEIKKDITFIPVKNYLEIYEFIRKM